MFVTFSAAVEAWAACQLHHSEKALERLQGAARDWEAAGNGLVESLYAALLAEGLMALGKPREAIAVTKGVLSAPRSEERCYVPLLLLIQAEASSALGEPAAVTAYRAAHASARQQGARLFEDRAVLVGSSKEA